MSTYIQCKVYVENKHGGGSWYVPGLARVDSEDPSYAATVEYRPWYIHPGFQMKGQSQLKSETGSTSGFKIWWYCYHNFFLKWDWYQKSTMKIRLKLMTPYIYIYIYATCSALICVFVYLYLSTDSAHFTVSADSTDFIFIMICTVDLPWNILCTLRHLELSHLEIQISLVDFIEIHIYLIDFTLKSTVFLWILLNWTLLMLVLLLWISIKLTLIMCISPWHPHYSCLLEVPLWL